MLSTFATAHTVVLEQVIKFSVISAPTEWSCIDVTKISQHIGLQFVETEKKHRKAKEGYGWVKLEKI